MSTQEEKVRTSLRRRLRRRIIIFIAQLLTFSGLLYLDLRYPNLTAIPGSGLRVIDAILFYIIIQAVISLSRIVVVFFYNKKKKRRVDFKDNFILGINHIANILSIVAVILGILILLNVSIRELFTSLSIIAVALTILTKEYILNLVNGMALMFSNQHRLNDDIQIGDHAGKIIDITLKHVVLLNEDKDFIYIPNSAIYHGNIINFSKAKSNKVVIPFELSPSQAGSVPELKTFILEGIREYENIIDSQSITLKVVSISQYVLRFKFEFNVVNRDKNHYADNIKYQVYFRVTEYLNRKKHSQKVNT